MSDLDAYSDNGSDEQDSEQESTAKFKREELVRGWREYEAKMPRVIPLIKHACKTDMGQVRENNEDKFDFYEPETPAILAARGCLYAVADGVGGALAGQIASEMMLKNLITAYYDHPAREVEEALREAIQATNEKVHAVAKMIPERAGMGTTLTCAVFVEDRVVIGQVGDSRAYLVRDRMARQVTNDHSWVEEQVRAGILSRYDAESSPFRNVITRSIGASPMVEPDFFEEKTRVGDVWVLCSDGLTGHVHDEEIARIVMKHAPSEAARQLVELANAHGGRDNITVFVLSVRDLLVVPTHFSGENAVEADPTHTSINTATEPAPELQSVVTHHVEAGAPLNAEAAVHPLSEEEAADARARGGWFRKFVR